MPNPKNYHSQKEWMAAWMHRRKQEKGKVDDQDLAIGLSMWRRKNKKKKKKSSVEDKIEKLSSLCDELEGMQKYSSADIVMKAMTKLCEGGYGNGYSSQLPTKTLQKRNPRSANPMDPLSTVGPDLGQIPNIPTPGPNLSSLPTGIGQTQPVSTPAPNLSNLPENIGKTPNVTPKNAPQYGTSDYWINESQRSNPNRYPNYDPNIPSASRASMMDDIDVAEQRKQNAWNAAHPTTQPDSIAKAQAAGEITPQQAQEMKKQIPKDMKQMESRQAMETDFNTTSAWIRRLQMEITRTDMFDPAQIAAKKKKLQEMQTHLQNLIPKMNKGQSSENWYHAPAGSGVYENRVGFNETDMGNYQELYNSVMNQIPARFRQLADQERAGAVARGYAMNALNQDIQNTMKYMQWYPAVTKNPMIAQQFNYYLSQYLPQYAQLYLKNPQKANSFAQQNSNTNYMRQQLWGNNGQKQARNPLAGQQFQTTPQPRRY